MSDFGDIPSVPTTGLADPTLTSQDPAAPVTSGSNRDSLNLDDFEKVEADQLPPSVSQSARVTSDLMGDIMAQVSHAGQQQQDLLAGLMSGTTKPQVSPDLTSFSISDDAFKRSDEEEQFDPHSSGDMMFTGGSSTSTTAGAPAEVDLLASAPPPPAGDFRDDSPPLDKANFDPFSTTDSFSSGVTGQQVDSLKDFMSADPQVQQNPTPATASESLFDPYSDSDDLLAGETGMSSQFTEEIKPTSAPITQAARDPSPEPIFKREPTPPLREASPEPMFQREPSPPFREVSPEPIFKREPTPPFREPTPPLRQPSPAREPTPPLREPTPEITKPAQPPRQPTPPREPTPPPREPTPPPREPTPPPREPTPPPRQPTPPPRQPTPPPREPTPPPRQPTPPREPTPPPREPTPPPREPTPPPRQPTPPREPTPPPREPTPPPRQPTPPTPVFAPTLKKAPIQEPHVTPGRTYHVSDATKASFAVFNPRAWFHPDQLDPRVVDLIYWRNVKKTGVVFGGVMGILLSLTYISLISVVSYTSLALLTGTITFRVYKNIMQAVQKSQDGHPFKDILELDTNLPQEKVHEATDVIVKQLNSTVTELKRLFLVEDLVDSVKFGCLLWCLTYLGAWFNGLTLVILAVVALFTLPKVYEQNQAQIDQYVGLVRTQVNDVMSKVKAALPIGNKEKAQ